MSKIKSMFFVLFLVSILAPKAHTLDVESGNTLVDESLDLPLQTLLDRSMPRFACNLSPHWKKKVLKTIDGQPVWIEITPAKGSIVAAPHLDDPDYFFHWNRDSALVVNSLVKILPQIRDAERAAYLHSFIRDFVLFSEKIQSQPTAFALGEVRFNVDGSLDTLDWNRPQNDGPALRALTLLSYFEAYGKILSADDRDKLISVIRRDIDYISEAYKEQSFDPWEYVKGFHFFVRIVQLGALEKAVRLLPEQSLPAWREAAAQLQTVLPEHWNAEKEFYSFSVGPVYTQPGVPVGQPGDGLDGSSVLGAIYSRRDTSSLSSLDDRLQLTAWKLEKHFRAAYPINLNDPVSQLGPACGRHPGDGYYGGNAWYVITSGLAEHYFNLANFYLKHPSQKLVISRYNQTLFDEILGYQTKLGENIMHSSVRLETIKRIAAKGEAFLKTMVKYTLSNGMMAEQFNKIDGSPVGATDLTWSYSSFLSAVLSRENLETSKINYSSFSLECESNL